MRKIVSFALGTVLWAFAFVSIAQADSWGLPEERTVCSENKKYCLKVIPKKLSSQLNYFKDKVDGKENAGGDPKAQKNLCRGIFSARDDRGSLKKRWEINLVNEVSPVDVLVSNQGDYVITFDNWHSVGYGDDAIAIYETGSGKLIRKFGLSEFLTESDIHNLPTSVSSKWWGGDHYIDKETRLLILQVTKGKRAFETNPEYFKVRVDLATGKVLDEKRDRLPSLQFVIQPVEETFGEKDLSAVNSSGCQGATDKLSSSELLKRAISQVRPEYPAAAKAVRAGGRLVIHISVGIDGTVACAESVSGHPLLRAAVTNALKKWTFEKSDKPYSGYVVFEGTSALVQPDGTVVKAN